MNLRLLNKLKYLLFTFFLNPEQHARRNGVKIGKNCSIGTRNFGSEPYLITIGNHVQITKNVTLLTHGGGWIFREEIPNLDFFGKINIMNNVYIGNGSYILPGVIIESNVIIAAGSVVTKSIPSGVIVGGNPAKIIGNVEDFKTKILRFNQKTKKIKTSQKRMLIELSDEDLFIKKPFIEIKSHTQ
jgi:acetyltransferase-like isoleucine patch superfamily enzyme